VKNARSILSPKPIDVRVSDADPYRRKRKSGKKISGVSNRSKNRFQLIAKIFRRGLGIIAIMVGIIFFLETATCGEWLNPLISVCVAARAAHIS
jgi:hypothetical protein